MSQRKLLDKLDIDSRIKEMDRLKLKINIIFNQQTEDREMSHCLSIARGGIETYLACCVFEFFPDSALKPMQIPSQLLKEKLARAISGTNLITVRENCMYDIPSTINVTLSEKYPHFLIPTVINLLEKRIGKFDWKPLSKKDGKLFLFCDLERPLPDKLLNKLDMCVLVEELAGGKLRYMIDIEESLLSLLNPLSVDDEKAEEKAIEKSETEEKEISIVSHTGPPPAARLRSF